MTARAPAFSAWLDRFFDVYYRQRPVNATFIGVHQYDDRLPDYSAQGIAEALNVSAALLADLRQLPDEPLSEHQAIDRRLAEGYLEIQRFERQVGQVPHSNPSEYISEAVFGLLGLFLRPFSPLGERVESAIGRLQAIPTLLEQGRANVRTAPPQWTERAIRECDGTLAFLGQGIDQLQQSAGVEDRRLRAAADRAALAVADFRRYLDIELRQLRPAPSDSYGCGAEAFDLLLRRGHFLPMGADEIEAAGWRQIEESRAALAAGAAALGAGSPAEALARLADAHPPAERYEARFAEVWKQAREAALAHDLVAWPAYPIRYVPRPVWSRAAAPSLYFLFYRAPAAFDRVPVVDYLIAPLDPGWSPEERERFLRANNDSVIKLNHVIHHGGLGHHVQNWYAYHRAASRVGQIAAVDCASRIAMICGGTMAEGWAVYTTELMGETDFLTPLERYSLHHQRLRMGARAVVDARLHTGRATLDEAVAIYREQVGMAPEAALAEAVKNSMVPGMALVYLIGTNLIHELRRELAARQGAAFELRAFHDRLLSYGSIPVSIIAERMRVTEDEGRAEVRQG